jgi:hypothetical protein
MALTATTINASPYHIKISVAEAGTAAAITQVNVASLLTTAGFGAGNPLFDLLNASYANQAAARTGLLSKCDVIVTPEVMSGATTSELLCTANVSGTAFRLDMVTQKAANGDTATFIVDVSFRHSIID